MSPHKHFLLAGFAGLFMFLTISSYTRNSAVWDEPQHLAAGYVALKESDFRFGPGQPPLLRMWAALPLLALPGIRLDTGSPTYRNGVQVEVCYEFLYRDNDGDRLLYPARFMIVLLGILLGCLVFVWSNELYGLPTAAITLLLFSLEPNILAHSSVVTSDLGFALFFFSTAYFLWRTSRALTVPSVLGLALSFGLAPVSKFSAILLAPIVLSLLLVRATDKSPWDVRLPGFQRKVCRPGAKTVVAGILLLVIAAASITVVWGTYRFQFALNPGAEMPNEFEVDPIWRRADSPLSDVMVALEKRHLVPRAFAEGMSRTLVKFPFDNYLAGSFQKKPFWYFFPAVLFLKTATALLVLTLGAAVVWVVGFRRRGGAWPYLLLPPAVYLAAAMLSSMNTGVRHLLPLYPFLIVGAGYAVRLLLTGWKRMLLAGLCCLMLVETSVVYPDYLAFFNVLAGGPGKGQRWLLDSNLDWGQGLKALKGWMGSRGVRHINLGYFGWVPPSYYGIEFTPINPQMHGAQTAPRDKPQLPGYVAISLTNLHGLFSDEPTRAFWAPLRARKPDAVIARSINVYWVDSPWWSDRAQGAGGN